jgi:exodeoxyribonuclease-3
MNQFLPVFRHNPDIVCIQETKTAGDNIPVDLKKLYGYHVYYEKDHPENLTEVILFSRQKPEHVTFGFGNTTFDREGRIVIAEYETFTLLNMYFPLGRVPSDTLEHKLAFYDAFLAYVALLNEEERKVIVCGDFSIAHTDLDVSKPEKRGSRRVGLTPLEREKLDRLIESGFSDTFRLFNEADSHYSWWPNGFSLQERSQGWRLDYFFVNSFLRLYVTGTEILACHEGSDHCPVMMEMEIPEHPFPQNTNAQEKAVRQDQGLRI